MNRPLKLRRSVIVLTVLVFFCITKHSNAVPAVFQNTETTSTKQQALVFLNNIKDLSPSSFWPHIKPDLFLHNIKDNVQQPIGIYPGNGTNFCGYGALTYLFLQDDPLGYTKLLLQLYQEGKAHFGKAEFSPSEAIKKEAGRLRYKGILD